MIVKELFYKVTDLLQKKFDHTESYRLASILLEDLYSITQPLSAKEVKDITKMEAAVKELLEDKPIQYVTGRADFYGYQFFVNHHVLIPRPETEELVRWILEDLKGDRQLKDVLDIGLGSGCISLSLVKQHKSLRVTGAEVSMDAMNVARINSRRLDAPISFALMDISDRDYWDALGRYDIIVSNPPYIKDEDRAFMSDRVLSYEPELALFPGEDPLKYYHVIHEFAIDRLNSSGKIYLEIHEDLAEEVKEIFSSNFDHIELRRDLQGKDRMIRISRA